MNECEKNFIEHEVRIRLLEKIAANIDKRFDDIEMEMKADKHQLLSKLDSNFHWTLGIMFTFMGGIILHMAKLI